MYTLDTANGAVKKAYSFGSSFQLGAIAGGVDSALVRTEGPKFALVGRDGSKQVPAINSFDSDTIPVSAAGEHLRGSHLHDTVTGGGARRLIHFSDDGSFDNDATLDIKGDIYDAVAASDDAVWIFYSASGQVQRLDPETLSPIDKTTLAVSGEGQSGRGIVWGAGAAWMYGVGGGEKGLVRVSEKDLSQLVIPLPADAGATYVGFGPASLGVQPL